MDERDRLRTTPLGCNCTARGDAFEMRAGDALFIMRRDAVRLAWRELWTDRQVRDVARSAVVAVRAVADDRLVSGARTMRLRVELGDGSVVVPLRRRTPHEVQWAAARLGEWHRGERPLDSRHAPRQTGMDEAEPARRKASSPAGPLRATPLRIPLAAAPRPGNCHSPARSRRSGATTLRVGPANILDTHRKAYPILFLLTLTGTVALSFAIGMLVETRGRLVPMWIIAAFAVTLLGAAAWGIDKVALHARAAYVVRLGPRFLHAHAVSRRWRRRVVLQSERIPRDDVIGVTVGQTSEQPAELRLDVLLRDGGRAVWLTGRPVPELRWVAAELAANLERVPVAPADRAGGPVVVDRILPYESPKRPSYDVTVRMTPDGGVLVIVPPLRQERLMNSLQWLVPMFFVAMMGVALWRARPALAYVASAMAAVLGGRLAMHLRRGTGAAAVLGVDDRFVYADFPGWLRRRRRWPRGDVRDVRLSSSDERGRPRPQSVEVMFANGGSLNLFTGRSDDDRRRIVGVLRGALGMPPIAPP